MPVEDVEIVEPAPDAPAPAPRRRRPVLLGVVVAVPVLAVGALLGSRALSGEDVDIEAVSLRVSDVAQDMMADRGATTMTGGVSTPPGAAEGDVLATTGPGTIEVTVVCASVRAAPAHLTVRSGGEVVGEATAACSDAADADVEPAVTTLPDVVVGDRWSFTLAPETTAAVAVMG